LVHAILEDFIAETVPGESQEVRSPDFRWNEEHRERLHAIADARFAEYEQMGRTGRPLLWRIQKEATLADLDEFLIADSDLRAELQMRPHDVELPFGMGDRAPSSRREDAAAAEVEAAGRTIRLRGLIDRVDWRSDGVPVVLDYKTGKAVGQKEFNTDPVRGGSSLQLGVYAEAAMQHYGTDTAQAHYWYVSARGGFKRAGYAWTDDRRARFADAVGTIVRGIEEGDFPPNPGNYDTFRGDFQNCAFCPFTRVCPVDRDGECERAVLSGNLMEYVAMRAFDSESAAGDGTPVTGKVTS